jgi:hypothetical protein
VTTIPVNGTIVEPGHVAFVIPEAEFTGEWQFCSAYRFYRDEHGKPWLEFASEADLESITSPEAS